jgi:hypothetical protein
MRQPKQADQPPIEDTSSSVALASGPRDGAAGCELLQRMEGALSIRRSGQRFRDHHGPVDDP